jgi:hypothetical protein
VENAAPTGATDLFDALLARGQHQQALDVALQQAARGQRELLLSRAGDLTGHVDSADLLPPLQRMAHDDPMAAGARYCRVLRTLGHHDDGFAYLWHVAGQGHLWAARALAELNPKAVSPRIPSLSSAQLLRLMETEQFDHPESLF